MAGCPWVGQHADDDDGDQGGHISTDEAVQCIGRAFQLPELEGLMSTLKENGNGSSGGIFGPLVAKDTVQRALLEGTMATLIVKVFADYTQAPHIHTPRAPS